MLKFWRKVRSTAVVVPCLMSVSALAIGASIGISWTKTEVTPVVLVKPAIGGFVPVEGDSILIRWTRAEVTPVLLVKPGLFGFVPREGGGVADRWSKQDVLPVMFVESSSGNFVPSRRVYAGGDRNESLRQTPPQLSSVIESRIDGDFSGWNGETIVRLMNGQIWQQKEYYYRYHYAFMPNVLIFMSGGTYKMKVDGIDKAVGVSRLK